MAEIIDAKRACEKHLLALDNTIKTAYEGVNFDPPDEMYQRCQIVIFSPDDPVFGTGYHRENMQFQVFVVDKTGSGTTNALFKANDIRSHFKKGTTLIENTTKILILETPQVAGTIIAQGKIVVPVLISLTVEVSS